MSLLEYRDRSEWELRSKLQKAEFCQEAVEEAIAYVKSFHYLDDERYAFHYVEVYRESRSIGRIRQDLRNKHISDELISLALENIDYDDSIALDKAFDKVIRGYDASISYEEQQKLMAKLFRKGFQYDQIRRKFDFWMAKQNQ